MAINKYTDLLHDSNWKLSRDGVRGHVFDVACVYGVKLFKVGVYNLYILHQENACARREEKEKCSFGSHYIESKEPLD